ncbi:MAG: hypothetical protein IT457_23525 [Planctomycetes bacterium]|nr:hypothetical protein [Planctomycetota bacterium]
MRLRLIAPASILAVALAACADSPVAPTSASTLAEARGSSNPTTTSSTARIRIFAFLTAPSGARFPSAKGKAHWDSRFSNSKRELEVEVEHLPSGLAVEFFIGGESVGTATTSALGEAELEFSTERGHAVPTSITGLLVEVRDASGALIASGSFPSA